MCHGVLESGSIILQAKGHDLICECTPWGCEISLVMIFFPDLNLVIARKSFHEGRGLMSSACIDNLINEGCWEVVFGTRPIEVMKFCANMNDTLFFIHGNMIRNPSGVRNGVDEASCVQLLYLGSHHGHIGRMDGPLLLEFEAHIGPSVDVVLYD